MNDCYPVMIVETYRMRISRIKHMLPWNEYGFQITTICRDAQRATAFYAEYLHKIVFVAISSFCEEDFCVIRQMRLLSDDVAIIGISKSEDYNTIRHAFKAGCNDVLLDVNVGFACLREILEEKRTLLDNNADSGGLKIGWKNRLETYLALIRDNQRVDEKIVLDLLEHESDWDILKGTYRLLMFRKDNIRKFNGAVFEYDKPEWQNSDEFIDVYQQRLAHRDEVYYHLNLLVEEIMRDCPQLHLLFPKKHSGLMVLPDMDLGQATDLAERIQERIYEELGLDFSCFVTKNASGVNAFLNLYREILELIPKKFYKGDKSLLVMEEEPLFISKSYQMNAIRENFLLSFEKKDFRKAMLDMERLLALVEKDNLHPEEVKRILCDLITCAEHWMHRKKIAMDYPFEILKKEVSRSESLSYVRAEMEKILEIMFRQISEGEGQNTSKKVGLMIDYIQEHLSEKMSLSEIADYVELSEIHTSRLFKKEMDMRLTEYINTRRIEKAKELLAATDVKIKEVAEKVGIADQLYFTKVFKKETGLSPREFRKVQ